MKAISKIFCALLFASSLSFPACTKNPTQANTETPPTTFNAANVQRAQSTPTPNRFELTRDAVLALVRPSMDKPVTAVIPKPLSGFNKLSQPMIDAKIITCTVGFGVFDNCKPGPNGKQLSLNNRGEMVLIIGRKSPTVTGVSRTDQTTAMAQVRSTFQPSSANYSFFKKWEGVFRQYNTNDEQHTVHLRLYDDGWRIEKID